MQPKFSVCGAHKTILLLQVLHILHSPDLLLILSDFADFIVCGFNTADCSIRCEFLRLNLTASVEDICFKAMALHVRGHCFTITLAAVVDMLRFVFRRCILSHRSNTVIVGHRIERLCGIFVVTGNRGIMLDCCVRCFCSILIHARIHELTGCLRSITVFAMSVRPDSEGLCSGLSGTDFIAIFIADSTCLPNLPAAFINASLLQLVGSSNVAVLSMCLEIQIITNAFVSGVCHNVPVASALHSLDMVQERHERSAVCAVGERCHTGNVFAVHCQLHIVCGLELTISHVVFFHPHEGGVLVCFGKAVPSASHLKQLRLVFLPTFQQLADFFVLPLPERFSSAGSVYHLSAFGYKASCKGPELACGQVAFSAVAVKQLFCLRLHLGQLLVYALSPNKGIPVRHALDLGPVDKYLLIFDFLFCCQAFYKLVEQVLNGLPGFSAAKTGKGSVVRHTLSLQQPDKVEILTAGLLQLPHGVDPAHIPVHQ